MSEHLHAPWHDDVVAELARWQNLANVHPYTCGNDHGEEVRLLPTNDGWICPLRSCGYTQGWCFKASLGNRQTYRYWCSAGHMVVSHRMDLGGSECPARYEAGKGYSHPTWMADDRCRGSLLRYEEYWGTDTERGRMASRIAAQRKEIKLLHKLRAEDQIARDALVRARTTIRDLARALEMMRLAEPEEEQ